MDNITIAISLKSELDSLRPINKDDELRIMQKFRLDWNYHSNHLEGNSLTYGETKALILFGITAQGKPLKDHFEISGHNEAINWVMDVVKQHRPLTEKFIRELHKLILKETYEVDAITAEGNPTKKRVEIGQYKSSPNHVKTKTGEIFRFATPEETPALMQQLVEWCRTESEKPEFNPLLIASEFHYRFIRIHPFDDGNGRTVRILMNFILLRSGYPPVVIKTEDKANYFSALRQADAGNLKPFTEYITTNLIHSLEIMIKGAKGKSIEEPDDIYKEIVLLEQKLKSISTPIEKFKSKDTLLEIFNTSITSLINTLVEKTKAFENFYIKTQHDFVINDHVFTSLVGVRPNIYDSTKLLLLNLKYTAFKQKGFQEFNYDSQIEFRFDYTKYSIISPNKKSIVKLYSNQLSEEEITEIVNTELKRHKNYIEQKIEQFNKKD